MFWNKVDSYNKELETKLGELFETSQRRPQTILGMSQDSYDEELDNIDYFPSGEYSPPRALSIITSRRPSRKIFGTLQNAYAMKLKSIHCFPFRESSSPRAHLLIIHDNCEPRSLKKQYKIGFPSVKVSYAAQCVAPKSLNKKTKSCFLLENWVILLHTQDQPNSSPNIGYIRSNDTTNLFLSQSL